MSHLEKYQSVSHLQVVPLPVTDGDTLRQAFIDHGQQHKVEFAEIDRSTDLNKVHVMYA